MQNCGQALRRSLAVGSSKGMSEFLMVCLARLMRWAMVGSGTRNAWAISAVVKPPTARKVSAIAEALLNAAWQHMKRSASVSSSPGSIAESIGSVRGPDPGRPRLRESGESIRYEYGRSSGERRPQ